MSAAVPRISGKADDGALLKRLGSAVRAERQLVNLSQEALAHAASIDRSHMGKIERGERNVTLLNLARIAAALGRRPSELLERANL